EENDRRYIGYCCLTIEFLVSSPRALGYSNDQSVCHSCPRNLSRRLLRVWHSASVIFSWRTSIISIRSSRSSSVSNPFVVIVMSTARRSEAHRLLATNPLD